MKKSVVIPRLAKHAEGPLNWKLRYREAWTCSLTADTAEFRESGRAPERSLAICAARDDDALFGREVNHD
jgi:hypothetical protein